MSTLKTWRNSRVVRLGLAPALGLALLAGIVLTLGVAGSPEAALAQSPCDRYVAPAPTGNDGGNNCATSGAPCASVQHAVDEAGPGDVICVASGDYIDVHVRPRNDYVTTGVVTQVVYIDKTVTIRGGYTSAFAEPPDPVANPTTLDAGGQGRVIYVTGNISPTIENLEITGGKEEWAITGDVGSGGGIFIFAATATIRNNQVFSNTAVNGGGLYARGNSGVVINNNTIHNNQANGGAGLCFINSSNATLVANIITQNVTTGGHPSAGGIYLITSDGATLIGNNISSNRAAGSGGVKTGGGLACRGSNDVTLSSNVIHGNEASNGGCGLYLDDCDNLKLTANVISENYGAGGGGLSVGRSTNVELTNNVISGNMVTRAGGGASFGDSHNVTLIGNIVTGNDTPRQGPTPYPDFGAGLYFVDSTNVNLIRNTITHNGPTVTFGGGLYMESSDVTMTNNVITDNEAEPGGAGSGLFIVDSSPHLLHTTIARNSGGDGSGVHITGTLSTVAMTNTIVATHEVGIRTLPGNTVTVNGVLWFNNGSNVDGPVAVLPGNEYTGDPAFQDDGYHLTFASAAIDKGVDAGVSTDIDGDPRPCQRGPDLGADEIACRFLPIVLKNR